MSRPSLRPVLPPNAPEGYYYADCVCVNCGRGSRLLFRKGELTQTAGECCSYCGCPSLVKAASR
jgi:hypothetical protein